MDESKHTPTPEHNRESETEERKPFTPPVLRHEEALTRITANTFTFNTTGGSP